jgi:hypothetical protein
MRLLAQVSALLVGVALLGGGAAAFYGARLGDSKDNVARVSSQDRCVGSDPVGTFRCRNTWISYLKTSYR